LIIIKKYKIYLSHCSAHGRAFPNKPLNDHPTKTMTKINN
jgi:hypothetical protein